MGGLVAWSLSKSSWEVLIVLVLLELNIGGFAGWLRARCCLGAMGSTEVVV